MNKQIANPNAVIKKDSALGVITMEGELAADLEYKQIEGYGQDYMMVRIEPVATEEYGDWDLYWLLENGEIIAGLGDGSSAYYLYYYCDGLHHTYEGRESSLEEPETAIPVQQTELMYDLDNLSDRDERMAENMLFLKRVLPLRNLFMMSADLVQKDCWLFAKTENGDILMRQEKPLSR